MEPKKVLAQEKANDLGIDVPEDAVLENAEITDIGIRFGRGTFMTMSVQLGYEGAGVQGYGGNVVLDDYDEDLEKRVGTEFGGQAIRRMVKVFGGDKLRDAIGDWCRAIHTRQKVFAVGHAVEDEWHSFARLSKHYDTRYDF